MFGFTDNNNPVQLYQLDSGGVRCVCMPPCAELEPYVHYYWWLEVLPGDTTLEVIPDNATDLVMSPEISRYSILYLSSPEKFSIPLTGLATYVGISCKAATLFRYFNLTRDAMSRCQPGEDLFTH